MDHYTSHVSSTTYTTLSLLENFLYITYSIYCFLYILLNHSYNIIRVILFYNMLFFNYAALYFYSCKKKPLSLKLMFARKVYINIKNQKTCMKCLHLIKEQKDYSRYKRLLLVIKGKVFLSC